MNRCLAFLLALLFATVSVSSACVAAPEDVIRFTLEPERGSSAKIHASFRDEALERRENRYRDENSWSTGFMPSELIGLEVSSFRAAGSRPLHFAIAREAGRLDCTGNGGNSMAIGTCRFTDNPEFTQLLVSRGIGRSGGLVEAGHAGTPFVLRALRSPDSVPVVMSSTSCCWFTSVRRTWAAISPR